MDPHDAFQWAELRRLADACLSREVPSAAIAHELATRVVAVLSAMEHADERSGPTSYRVSTGRTPDEALPDALVALERCKEERAALQVQLAALRAERR